MINTQSTVGSLLTKLRERGRGQRYKQIYFDPQKCTGCWQCYEVCPVDNWFPDRVRRVAEFHDPGRCIACGACVLQCPEIAIELR